MCRDQGFHKYIQNVTSSPPHYHRSNTRRSVSELVLFCTHMGHREQHEALKGKGMGMLVSARQTRAEEDVKQLQGLGRAGMPREQRLCTQGFVARSSAEQAGWMGNPVLAILPLLFTAD